MKNRHITRNITKNITKIAMVVAMIITLTITVNARTVIKANRLTVTQGKFGTKVKWDGKVIRWYDFNGKVKLVPERKLAVHMLEKRKNRILYIEKVTGRVLNNRLDGRTTNGNYISYRSLKGKVRKGDVVITYCIYNPYTHWFDDIDERYDVVIKQKARR